MPKLSTAVVTTTTQEIKIAPVLKKKLQTKLQTYAGLKSQLDAIKHAMVKLTNELGELRDETGEMSVFLDGYGRITLVGGTYKKLNKKKLIALGCAAEWLNQATEEKPKKPFNKITLPGEKDEEEDDE